QSEHAIGRESLRLALSHHKSWATGLKGVQQEPSISDGFEQKASGETLRAMPELELIGGSGGILSHAPRRVQSLLMMVDAYEPLGFTELAVDSIFMMPHLGVLSAVNEQAATDVFVRDCLIHVGTCVAPIGQGARGERCADYVVGVPSGGEPARGTLAFGELRLFPLADGEEAAVAMTPARSMDMGAGRGVPVERRARGGVVGVVLDGRGRPLQFPTKAEERVRALKQWHAALN